MKKQASIAPIDEDTYVEVPVLKKDEVGDARAFVERWRKQQDGRETRKIRPDRAGEASFAVAIDVVEASSLTENLTPGTKLAELVVDPDKTPELGQVEVVSEDGKVIARTVEATQAPRIGLATEARYTL